MDQLFVEENQFVFWNKSVKSIKNTLNYWKIIQL